MCLQGELLQGRLQVSNHRPQDEATVTVSGERGGREGERRIAVLGVTRRNRAIHNDRVAVRLIQHSERPTTDGMSYTY